MALLAAADAGSVRLLLLGEIVSAADFDRDHLYVEWMVSHAGDSLAWGHAAIALMRWDVQQKRNHLL